MPISGSAHWGNLSEYTSHVAGAGMKSAVAPWALAAVSMPLM